MRKLLLLLALVLVPAFAFAHDGEDHATSSPAKPPIKAEVRGEGGMPMLPKVGPAVRDIASSTRAEIKEAKDAAQALLEQKRAAIKTFVGDRKEDIASTTMMLRERILGKKSEVEARAEEAKGKAREKFNENVQVAVGNIADRLTKAVSDFSSIADRIEAKITEEQAKGTDMGGSVTALAAARADIATAQDKVTAASGALSTALAASSPKDQMAAVRTAVKAAEDALKTAKQSLHTALKTVKVEAQASVSVEAAN